MNNENTKKIVEIISTPRLNTYRALGSTGSSEGAIHNYFHIQEVSSHFFVPMQVLEISLRNSMNTAFRKHYGTPEWYDHIYLTSCLSKQLKHAIKRLKKERKGTNKRYTPDDIIAKLMFGFWVFLMDDDYRSNQKPYHFWQYILDDVFPGRNGKSTRLIFQELKWINNTRNRLYHHEPIWTNNKGVRVNSVKSAIKEIDKEYCKLLDVIQWICPENKNLLIDLGFHSRFKECSKKHSE